MSKLILISIKEKYVKQILSGKKTIELRKAKPQAAVGDTIIIYTTQPTKAVTAIAIVNNIIICTPEEMWKVHKKSLGIDKADFETYYANHKKAVGIELREVHQLDGEILLSAIKMIHPQFSPPQTFKYLNKFTALRGFKNLKGLDNRNE